MCKSLIEDDDKNEFENSETLESTWIKATTAAAGKGEKCNLDNGQSNKLSSSNSINSFLAPSNANQISIWLAKNVLFANVQKKKIGKCASSIFAAQEFLAKKEFPSYFTSFYSHLCLFFARQTGNSSSSGGNIFGSGSGTLFYWSWAPNDQPQHSGEGCSLPVSRSLFAVNVSAKQRKRHSLLVLSLAHFCCCCCITPQHTEYSLCHRPHCVLFWRPIDLYLIRFCLNVFWMCFAYSAQKAHIISMF